MSRPPSLFMSMRQPMHGTSCPKSQLKSTCLTAKFGRVFRPRGNGRKRTKCDQFFCPTSDFFDFCNPYFFYHTFTNDVILLTKPMQKSVTTVCLHCSFARLKNKHIGVLGTNVISWLHWSPVSGYMYQFGMLFKFDLII